MRTAEERIRREWRILRKQRYWRQHKGALRLRLAEKYRMPCWRIDAIVRDVPDEQVLAERKSRENNTQRLAAREERQVQEFRRNLKRLSHHLRP